MIKTLTQDEKDKKLIDKLKKGIARIDRELISGNGFSKETNVNLRNIYIYKLQEFGVEYADIASH